MFTCPQTVTNPSNHHLIWTSLRVKPDLLKTCPTPWHNANKATYFVTRRGLYKCKQQTDMRRVWWDEEAQSMHADDVHCHEPWRHSETRRSTHIITSTLCHTQGQNSSSATQWHSAAIQHVIVHSTQGLVAYDTALYSLALYSFSSISASV